MQSASTFPSSGTMPQPITVIGVDDHRGFREGIARAASLLSQHLGRPVTTYLSASGLDLETILRDEPADQSVLVVLDIRMPTGVDGRLLGPWIRTTFPHVQILPCTSDHHPTTLDLLRRSGMLEPVLKPVSLEGLTERMAMALTTTPPPGDPTIQAVQADLAQQFVTLHQRRQGGRSIQVGILAQRALTRVGLPQMLSGVSTTLAVDVAICTDQVRALQTALQQRRLDILLCDAHDYKEIEGLSQAYHIPLLVYTSIRQAKQVLRAKHSVILDPASNEAWADAFQMVLSGATYAPRWLDLMISLLPRDRQILGRIQHGVEMAQLAANLGITEARLRQRISNLYRLLDLPPHRASLVAWAQAIPPQWFQELDRDDDEH
ncbi:response regulator transcription factor [Candidatus Chloroploca sp. M-50]|uniref:Response regulator transcription factor n=1 Tax=Candidatus Chloroploca mongolica TaxID=2528176 RepID=A0ABS4DBQ0_9CHLR|nr:response regulator transcription factor [Candidatus Chloroploca mongolica]MBP1466724.1 response regulator transcription factor [Candidatus Chloroploca mongolica]